MKKFLVGSVVIFGMATSMVLVAETLPDSQQSWAKLRICDPLGGGYDADRLVAQRVQDSLAQMSSVQWVLGPIGPAATGDETLLGPATFSVGYGEYGMRPTAELLLTAARSFTTCGELRIGL